MTNLPPTRMITASGSCLKYLLVFLCLLWQAPVGGTTPIAEVGCPAQARQLCDAFAIADHDQQRIAVFKALREGLLSDQKDVREAVWRELDRRSYSTDLSPYLSVIKDLAPPTRGLAGAEMVDRILRLFGPRPSRIALFLQAIRSGSTSEPHGTILRRQAAVYLAAHQGLAEVRPAAEEYLSTIPPGSQSARSLEGILSVFDLCAGATNGTDCPEVALGRLDSMDERDVRERLRTDITFRKGLSSIRTSACGNIFRRNTDPCRRFAKWESSLEDEKPSEPTLPAETLTPPTELRWIDPCTVPEFSDYFLQGTRYGVYARLSVASEAANARRHIGLADGLVGYRNGETVRLHLDVHEEDGAPPTWPVAVRIEVPDGMNGFVSPSGQGLHCKMIQFLWNHPEAAGGVVPVRAEFDYTVVGRPDFLARIPTGTGVADFSDAWKSAAHFKITTGEFLKSGDELRHAGDATWEVRPVGRLPSDPVKLTVERVQRLLEGVKDQAELLDSNLRRPETFVIREPRTAYVAHIGSETDPSIDVVLSSESEDGEPVDSGVHVTLYRLGTSRVYLGTFRMVPDGYPKGAYDDP